MRTKLRLERLRSCLKYWDRVPEEMVLPYLDNWVQAKVEDYGRPVDSCVEAHLAAVGLDWLHCGTIACLGGALITMPKVIEDYVCGGGKVASLTDRIAHLRGWMGYDGIMPRDDLFHTRSDHEADPSVSDHQVARDRLVARIAMVERDLQ